MSYTSIPADKLKSNSTSSSSNALLLVLANLQDMPAVWQAIPGSTVYLGQDWTLQIQMELLNPVVVGFCLVFFVYLFFKIHLSQECLKVCWALGVRETKTGHKPRTLQGFVYVLFFKLFPCFFFRVFGKPETKVYLVYLCTKFLSPRSRCNRLQKPVSVYLLVLFVCFPLSCRRTLKHFHGEHCKK